MPDQMLGCSTVLDLLTIFPGYLGLSEILQKLSRESLHTAMAQHPCSALGMRFLRAVECSWAGVRKDASLKTFIFSIWGWKSSQEWFTIQIVVKTYAWSFATNICIQTSKVWVLPTGTTLPILCLITSLKKDTVVIWLRNAHQIF